MRHDRGDAACAILSLSLCLEPRQFSTFEKGLYDVNATQRKIATLDPYGDGHVMKELVARMDSDCAGDHNARKSAFCPVLQVDGCVLSVICRGQQLRARFPASSQDFAAVKGLDRLATLARALRVVWKTDGSSTEKRFSCRSICTHASSGRTGTTNAHWTSCC